MVKWELLLALGKALRSTIATEEGNPNVISLFINLLEESKDTKHGKLLLGVMTARDPKLTKAH